MVFIPIEQGRKYNPEMERYDAINTPCPFGVRDLEQDRCYDGNGVNRCEYFVRYDWEEHPGCIACSCTLPRKEEIKTDERGNKYVIDEDGNPQGVFDF